jgi:hypothetical protein
MQTGVPIPRLLTQLTELHRFVTAQNAQKLDHPHTLSGFRPAHSISPKGQEFTGQIVRYLKRSYRVLPTGDRSRISTTLTDVI